MQVLGYLQTCLELYSVHRDLLLYGHIFLENFYIKSKQEIPQSYKELIKPDEDDFNLKNRGQFRLLTHSIYKQKDADFPPGHMR